MEGWGPVRCRMRERGRMGEGDAQIGFRLGGGYPGKGRGCGGWNPDMRRMMGEGVDILLKIMKEGEIQIL